MKIPKAPVPSRETKVKLQPELRIRNITRFIGVSAIISIPILIVLVTLNIIPLISIMIIPLLGFIIYKESKRYDRYNDIVVLKRVINDAEYNRWYNKYIANNAAKENENDSDTK